MANGHGLCPSASSALDLSEPCVRGVWATLLPTSLVLVFLLFALRIPAPSTLKSWTSNLSAPFQTYLTLPEAEAYLSGASPAQAAAVRNRSIGRVKLWRSVVQSALALALTLAWTVGGAFRAALHPEYPTWRLLQPFIVGSAWLYAALKPTFAPKPTVAYDLFALYILHLVGSVLTFGGALYDSYLSAPYHAVPTNAVVLNMLNLGVIVLLLLVSLSTPIALPSSYVVAAQVGRTPSTSNPTVVSESGPTSTSPSATTTSPPTPEDYTTLYGWLSFAWVSPLVASGTSTTLNEKDVWALSPTLQSAALFRKLVALRAKFGSWTGVSSPPGSAPSTTTPASSSTNVNSTKTRSKPNLLRLLWAANSLDILLDASLTVVSILFAYAGPFFLREILASISSFASFTADPNSTPEEEAQARASRAKAYVYAALTLLASVIKAQADLQHLWFGRRAGTRVRSELMAVIYEKALRRVDYGGIVDKEKQAEAANAKYAKDAKDSKDGTNSPKGKGKKTGKDSKNGKNDKDGKKKDEDENRAGADVGKIVNLMSGDANR
jgi:hypothetical protein